MALIKLYFVSTVIFAYTGLAAYTYQTSRSALLLLAALVLPFLIGIFVIAKSKYKIVQYSWPLTGTALAAAVVLPAVHLL